MHELKLTFFCSLCFPLVHGAEPSTVLTSDGNLFAYCMQIDYRFETNTLLGPAT